MPEEFASPVAVDGPLGKRRPDPRHDLPRGHRMRRGRPGRGGAGAAGGHGTGPRTMTAHRKEAGHR